eukprot:1142707-Pelagomonas_calceolata.AAC.7
MEYKYGGVARWSSTCKPCLLLASEKKHTRDCAHPQVWEAAEHLQDTHIFSAIDRLVAHNLRKVQAAFREHRVGPQHFQGSTGYGHGDWGRETLDNCCLCHPQQAAVAYSIMSRELCLNRAALDACAGVAGPGGPLLHPHTAVATSCEEYLPANRFSTAAMVQVWLGEESTFCGAACQTCSWHAGRGVTYEEYLVIGKEAEQRLANLCGLVRRVLFVAQHARLVPGMQVVQKFPANELVWQQPQHLQLSGQDSILREAGDQSPGQSEHVVSLVHVDGMCRWDLRSHIPWACGKQTSEQELPHDSLVMSHFYMKTSFNRLV